jgi:hypothetical protein
VIFNEKEYIVSTIVMNTLLGGVTEYDNFDFDSITPTHAGSTLGLYALGGDLDVIVPIASEVRTGKSTWGSPLKKYVDVIFYALKGTGQARGLLLGENTSYGYNFPIERDGESRCKPGRGIRENYLAFGLSKSDGADFQLDRIEVNMSTSGTRRTR